MDPNQPINLPNFETRNSHFTNYAIIGNIKLTFLNNYIITVSKNFI